MTERYVTIAEVRELLTEVSESRIGPADLLEEQEVLKPSQKTALDHARKVSKISQEDAEKLIEEVSQIEGVTDSIAVKIADILPEYPEDVRTLFYKKSYPEGALEQIAEIVSKYI